MNVTLTGDEAALLALGMIERSLSQTDDALVEAGEFVQGLARRLAPVRTGVLVASTNMRKRGRTVVVAATAPYAQFVHYGSIHNPRPIPFIDMAAHAAQPMVHTSVDRHVNSTITRAGF